MDGQCFGMRYLDANIFLALYRIDSLHNIFARLSGMKNNDHQINFEDFESILLGNQPSVAPYFLSMD